MGHYLLLLPCKGGWEVFVLRHSSTCELHVCLSPAASLSSQVALAHQTGMLHSAQQPQRVGTGGRARSTCPVVLGTASPRRAHLSPYPALSISLPPMVVCAAGATAQRPAAAAGDATSVRQALQAYELNCLVC